VIAEPEHERTRLHGGKLAQRLTPD
jgi:hypothetical protein